MAASFLSIVIILYAQNQTIHFLQLTHEFSLFWAFFPSHWVLFPNPTELADLGSDIDIFLMVSPEMTRATNDSICQRLGGHSVRSDHILAGLLTGDCRVASVGLTVFPIALCPGLGKSLWHSLHWGLAVSRKLSEEFPCCLNMLTARGTPSRSRALSSLLSPLEAWRGSGPQVSWVRAGGPAAAFFRSFDFISHSSSS